MIEMISNRTIKIETKQASQLAQSNLVALAIHASHSFFPSHSYLAGKDITM